jgi:NAD(P)-dependent dehydrogenase (short-subunit alcohol dehydrogenase family)
MPELLPVLVTGANQGIGLALVKLLVTHPEKRYHVFLCYRDAQKGEAALATLPSGTGSAEVLQLHVTNSDSIAAAAKHVASKCPEGLHALVNNAGVGYDLPFSAKDNDPTLAQRTMATNYYGAVAVIDALLSHMSKGGRIVNVTSGKNEFMCCSLLDCLI